MALPEAVEKPFGGHEAPAFRVRDKIFLNVVFGMPRLGFHCKGAPGAQDALVHSMPDVFYVPPYSGHNGWIGVNIDVPLDWEFVAELIHDSYRLVVPKKLAALVPEDSRTY